MKKIIISLLLYTAGTLTTSSIETAMEYQKNELYSQAIACYEKIVKDEPNNINAWFNLGNCYLAVCNKEKAVASFDNILKINPHSLSTLFNKAFTLKTFGDLDEAISIYHRILEIDPHYKRAQSGLGVAYITQGDFERGWKYHELFFAGHPKNGDALRSFLHNNTIRNKRILLYPSGGLGDTFQFIRYAESLKNMGAYVIVNCQKNLFPLLSRCSYIDYLIPEGSPVPDCDAETTLMVIPTIFASNQATAPRNIPYLFADPQLITHWQNKLAPDTNFKVGICWQSAGDDKKPISGRRGCPLKHFARLSTLEGVSFYSLQKHDGIEQLETLGSDFQLQVFDDLDEQTGAFMDTAALIKNLDLIISIDTSIVHLAGGLGATVWMLHSHFTPDWRWIINRTDSYWYPHLRIFKQHKAFDWDSAIEDIYTELQQLIEQRKNMITKENK